MIRLVSISIAGAVLLAACGVASSIDDVSGAADGVSTAIPPVTSLPPVPIPVSTTTAPTSTSTTTTVLEVPTLVTVPSYGDVVDLYAMEFVGSTDSGVAVTVNDEPAQVDSEGNFTVPVVNDLGLNTVTVRLDDGSGVTSTSRVRYEFSPPDGWIAAIGDSVMLGSAPEIEKRLGDDIVDATVSRQFLKAPGLVEGLVARAVPTQVIIVALGTNGPAQERHFDQVMEAAGSERLMVFVNVRMPRSWEGASNRTIAEGVERYDNAVLVDWYSVTKDRNDLFAADGVHPRQRGRVIMAELIADAIFPNWVPAEEG